jgi:hypothetical protein
VDKLDPHVDVIVPAVIRKLEAATTWSYEEVFDSIALLLQAYYSGGRDRRFRTVPRKYFPDLRRLATEAVRKATHSGVTARAKTILKGTSR